MVWLGIVLLVFTIAVTGIRRAQRNGTWSWSKFALTLGFMAVFCAIITAPLLMNTNSRIFLVGLRRRLGRGSGPHGLLHHLGAPLEAH